MSGENRELGIGRSLERARQSRGLSLWQVEQETRIRSRYLRDLEREDFDVLPAVYVLGSLKTYADFLGLDGAALSRQLKARLVEPAEPDAPAQLGGTPDEDDEYEAAPVPAVGFDQLFLGMGVILISILAVMTIVAAVAQGDESPVSQINQPSTPDASSEIALAGNVQDGDAAKGDDEPGKEENREDQPEKEPESPKDGEKGEDGDGQQASATFDGVEFVPMPQSSSATASASASAVPSSASPASSSSARSSPGPTNTRLDDPPTFTAPAASEAPPLPAEDDPGSASPAAPRRGASPQAGSTEEGEPAPAGETEVADQISAEANRTVGEAFEKAGIVR